MSANSHDHLVKARLSFLDVLGAGALGQASQIAAVLGADVPRTNLVADLGLPHVTGERLAFDNAMFMHYEDFDDSHLDIGGHPSCVIVPALWAVVHDTRHEMTLARFLESYVYGIEVMARLGRALNPSLYESGTHPTSFIGAPAAAAASAHLTGLSLDETMSAVGLAFAGAGGVKGSFGSDAKSYQVACAARSGYEAATLAARGVRADFASIVNGPKGVLAVRGFAVPPLQADAILAEVGDVAAVNHPGVIIKQYAACGSTHSSIDAALDLRREHPELVARLIDEGSVRVSIDAARLGHVNRPSPSSPLEAKFSLQFATAHALVKGEVPLTAYTPTGYVDPAVRALMSRVSVEGFAGGGDVVSKLASRIVLEVDGDVVEHVRPMADGRTPGEMLASERVTAKFLQNCAALTGERAATRILTDLLDDQAWARPVAALTCVELDEA